MTAADLTSARWDWLLLAVMTATLASLARWAIAQPAVARSRFGPAVTTVAHSPWLVHPLRFLHSVGIPAVALYWQHALSAKDLGLKALPRAVSESAGVQLAPGLDVWAQDIGTLGFLVVAITALVSLGDRAAKRWGTDVNVTPGRRDWAVALREGIIHQVRWAFYREPFVFVWGAAVGSWLGALPVVLEALVSPTFWESLRPGHPERTRAMVVRAGLLVGSVIIYLKTQNLWVAIALDVLLGWLLLPNALGAENATVPSPLPARQ